MNIGDMIENNKKKRQYPDLDVDSIMPFGKYQGRTVEDILDDNPSYIQFLAESGTGFSDEVYEYLATVL